MTRDKQALLRQLPSVDDVLRAPAAERLMNAYSPALVTDALRRQLDDWRQQILAGHWLEQDLSAAMEQLYETLQAQLQREQQPSLCSVINGTGIIIHTNLGRSLLAPAAKRQIAAVAGTYSTLEVDVETGRRGLRYAHVVDLLQELTGAEDALVVNNNAGAVLLTLAALTAGHEVVVSRGQLVEIGGSFRIPEVMEQSGCQLVEVGTTNKTHLFDYERAIGPATAALLKVHTSNYRVIGFTDAVSGQDMARLAHEHGLLAIEDLGSGVFLDLEKLGHLHEPTVQEALASGMDIVTFSGDKLLGGPQAGIVVGKREYIERLRQHPLTRALRIGKLTLAGLEATLRLYLDPAAAAREIPTLRMLSTSVSELQARGRQLLAELADQVHGRADIALVDSWAQVGGGALPGYDIPSVAVAAVPHRMSPSQLEQRLRQGQPPVFARVQHDQVLLDLRTVQPDEISQLGEALLQAL